jgi:hypothetical protein
MWQPQTPRRRARDSRRRRWDLRSTLACPSCGEAGRNAFEGRGHAEGTGAAVVRCSTCLSGMTVGSRRVLARREMRLIDPVEWSQMETAWAETAPSDQNDAADPVQDPERLVLDLCEHGFSGDTLTHLVAETLGTSPVEAALLITRTTASA